MTGLLFLGFIGGALAGGTALGIDTIFTPMLLIFGFNPKVAKATGMYLTAQYSLGVLIITLFTGTLNYKYGLFLGGLSCIASLVMLWLTAKMLRKYGDRASYLVMLLSVMLIATLVVSIFAARQDFKMMQADNISSTSVLAVC